MAGLERATAGRRGGYVESVEQMWWVGTDGMDRGLVKYTTTLTKPPRGQADPATMAWRRVRIFASSTIPTPSTEAMDFRASDPAGPMEVIRVKETGGEVDYVVFFNDALQPGRPCQWQVDYTWPQFFDPWRKEGTDKCSVEFSVGAPHASIRIVWPAGKAPAKFRRRSPAGGTVIAEEFGGLNSLVWEFGPCSPGQVFRVDL